MAAGQEKQTTQVKPGRLAASATLGALNEEYYQDLAGAKAAGRPVVWITSMAPIEMVYAFDGIPFFPENYAALCSSRKVASDLCQAAEARGYSPDLCSYALCTFGVIFEGRGAFGDAGPPGRRHRTSCSRPRGPARPTQNGGRRCRGILVAPCSS